MTMPEQIEFVRGMTAEMEPKWHAAGKRALSLLAKLDEQPRHFFDENVMAQIEIHKYSNRYLRRIVDAVDRYEGNQLAKAAFEARECAELPVRASGLR